MSQDDLLSVLTGGKQSLTPGSSQGAAMPAAQAPTFANDTDAAIRTVYGEADPEGRQAVAAVIRNRAQKSGKSASDVVLEPSAFTAWSDPKAAARMMALKTTDPVYQQIAQQIAPVMAGKVDPTGGADAYYNPDLQNANGAAKPPWDDGNGQKIGAQLYFKGVYHPTDANGSNDDLMSILGVKDAANAAPAASEAPEANVKPIFSNSDEALNPADAKLIRQMVAGGTYDHQAQVGTVNHPYVIGGDGVLPSGPGQYYIQQGQLHQMPGKPVGTGEAIIAGVGRGLEDVGAGLNKITAPINNLHDAAANPILGLLGLKPQHTNALIQDRNTADNLTYAPRYGDNLTAGVSRFGANVAATAPIMAAGGEVLGPALGAAGPVGEFLAGAAGKGGQGLPNLLLRGASLATRGAGEGAQAAALTSGASDTPLLDQMKEGAGVGGVIGVGAPAAAKIGETVGNTARALVDPFTESGQQRIVNKIIQKFATGGPTEINPNQLIPGSQPTLSGATQNPGIATLEKTMKSSSPEASNLFAERQVQNADARASLFDTLRGDEHTVDSLRQARDTATEPLRVAAFANKTAADASPVVAKIDEILASPSGQNDAVKEALSSIRNKIASKDSSGVVTVQTDPEQLWGIRKAIDTSLSPLARGTTSDKRLAASELVDVKGELDKAIEGAAPGFKNYLKAYSEASKPIDEASYLQSLNLTDSKGNLTLAKVDGAIKRIDALRKAGGVNPAKNISDDTYQQLSTLRNDLKRDAVPIGLGRDGGSDTGQKLASGNIVSTMGVPLALGMGTLGHNPIAGIALAGAKMVYDSKNKQLENRLIQTLLNPDNAKVTLDNGSKTLGVKTPYLNRLFAPSTGTGVLAQRNLLLGQPQ